MKSENDIKSLLGTKEKYLKSLQKQIRRSIENNNEDIDFLRRRKNDLRLEIDILTWILK